MDELLQFSDNPIDRFIDRFGTGQGHLEMAYHAALPLALTPDLLYLIWANFRLDAQDRPLSMQWVTVADLILSPLCREIRHETYVMETAVRQELLDRMAKDERFGPEYILRLGQFIQHYASQYIQSDIPSLRQYAQAQQWAAQAYTEPDRLIEGLASQFRQPPGEAETMRLAELLQTFSEPLNLDWVPTSPETAVNYDRLHAFGDGLAKFARGDAETASRQLRRLLGPARELNIGPMALPVPAHVSQALANQEEKIYTYRVTVQDETAVVVEHIDHAGNTTNSLVGQLRLPDDEHGENLPSSQEIDHSYLRRVIISAFSDTEIVDIIFDLGLDLEDFAYAGKAVRIASLISYMQRRNRLDELLKLCMEHKPDADWAQVLEGVEAPTTPSFNRLLRRVEDKLATTDELRQFGQQLFAILFNDELRTDFLVYFEQAIKDNAFLRLALNIDNNFLQDVALLPWELLCLPDGTGFGTDWLAAAPELMVHRLSAETGGQTHFLPPAEPLRLALVVGAHAYTESPLRHEIIWEAYQTLAARYPDQFELLPLLIQPTADKLDALLQQQPHIVHAVVHAQSFGLKERDEGQVALILKDYPEEFSGEWMTGDQLGRALSGANPGFVLLQSNEFAQPDMLRGLQDVAAMMSEATDVPAVLSWQFPVAESTAAKFILTVFPALAQGIPLDEAVQNGRRALLREENPLAFAAPSLFANAIVRRRTASEAEKPVLPASLGVAFAGDDITLLLHKETPLPATSELQIMRHRGHKYAEGFGYLDFQLFQGESTNVHEVYQLGAIQLDDNSLYTDEEIELEITLTASSDGTVHIQLFHQSGFHRDETFTLITPEAVGSPSAVDFDEMLQRFSTGVREISHLATLTAVSNWLNDTSAERVFLLTGERGRGKTTIAALLAQYFRGDRQPPNNLYALAPTSTSAIYFCQPSRPETLNPRSFALTIASQWAGRDSHFAHLQSIIDHHEAYELDELVEQLLIKPFSDIDELIYPGSIVFLVDDLEAALQHPGDTNIVDVILRMLREVYGVRFLLTAQMQPTVRSQLADIEARLYQLPPYFNPIFDFSASLNTMAQRLPGFQTLLQAVDAWLVNPKAAQHGGIFPEPYTGKSAAAASLIRLSQGTLPELSELTAGLTAVQPGFISAYHLYQSTDPRTMSPRHFIQSVAAQLANAYPAYNEALRETIERWQNQQAAQKMQTEFRLDDDLPGADHPYLNVVNQIDVNQAFDQLIIQPWLNVFETTQQEVVILILIDGVDEMLAYQGANSIPALLGKTSLPSFMRFFLAANEEPALVNLFTGLRLENFRWEQFEEEGRARHPDARFMADVTLPDDTLIKPEETFTKTWRLRNIGLRNWNKAFSLVFIEGIPMTETLSQSVPELQPGEEADISVTLTAPLQPGPHLSVWQLRDAEGVLFGDHVWAKIIVDDTAEPVEFTSAGRYENVDIQVGPPLTGPDMRHPITATAPASGETQTGETYSPTAQLGYEQLASLRDLVSVADEAAEVGQALFRSLLPDNIYELVQRSLASARRRGVTGLRLRVQFEDPVLQSYPWELCHDGRSFIFNNPDQPILLQRTVSTETVQTPPPLPRPVRLLVAIAAPVDQGRADVDMQEKTIHLATEELVTSSELDLQILRHATLRKLSDMVQSYEPDIVQFISHSSGEKEGVLILENESGRSNLVPVGEITRFLANAPVQFVMLSPIGMGENSVTQLAPQFIQQGIPAVLADQYVLPDQPAVEFLRTFYTALLSDRLSFEEAVWHGRNRLATTYREPFWCHVALFEAMAIIDTSVLNEVKHP